MDKRLELTVGDRISALRGKMSLDELSKKIGVSRQAVAKWEKNTAQPRVVQLEALAAALGTTPVYIAFGMKDPDEIDPVSRSITRKLPLLDEIEREHLLPTVNLLLANKRSKNSQKGKRANGNGETQT